MVNLLRETLDPEKVRLIYSYADHLLDNAQCTKYKQEIDVDQETNQIIIIVSQSRLDIKEKMSINHLSSILLSLAGSPL